MVDDTIPPSMQESLLALLAFDDKHGTTVAAQVRIEHFSEPYQEVASKILAYRRKHGKAPGQVHLDDIFGWALTTGDRAPRLRRLLTGIFDIFPHLNAEYVANSTGAFVEKSTIVSAIFSAAEMIQAHPDGGDLTQIRQTLYEALSSRRPHMDAGIFLNDTKRSLSFFDRRSVDYPLGIQAFDNINLGMTAKQLLLYIGPKNTGKSWFCVHCGRQGLIHRANVLHITLEMGVEEVLCRYYQNWFSATLRDVPYNVTRFELDENRRVSGTTIRQVRRPKISFDRPGARRDLQHRIISWGGRLGKLCVKEFPSGFLTIPDLISYLDYLEAIEKFIPNIMIVDYPDLMEHPVHDRRISIGKSVVQLRGLGGQRNMAVVAPTQGGRQTIDARHVSGKDVTEDISKVFTADNVLTYSQTVLERRRNLARLNLDYARSTRRDIEVLISQSYETGQFVLESGFMANNYWDHLEAEATN
jgi:hypothetical protein